MPSNHPQATILLLPGLNNSDEEHWQTYWERMLPNAQRVRQQEWDAPVRSDWVATLDAAIRAAGAPVILVAHSLGCALVAWWTAQFGQQPHAAKVKGALLVAPPDVERADFPDCASGFAPMPQLALPFPSTVIASSDDPWCAPARTQSWAADWGAQFHLIGAHGHINAASRLADWAQGRDWLRQLEAGASVA
ncbi:RBBP9/YdeN family alpha/beta hydrolase [Paraherbaspirillum soli]|uniref:RBBP9/YdeN family alpha/beta hydrolase n=1 Tax=Paraherbaspirillum soli TaxID=631222 RepID=A0ABW0M4Z0_9BURK